MQVHQCIKPSDADFPQWRGWQLVVDDDDNSRCEAKPILDLIADTDKSGKRSKSEAQDALQDQDSAVTLQDWQSSGCTESASPAQV